MTKTIAYCAQGGESIDTGDRLGDRRTRRLYARLNELYAGERREESNLAENCL
jgi:hypothetical protein